MTTRTRTDVERDHHLRSACLEKAKAELTEGRKAFQDAEREYLQTGKKQLMEKTRDAEDAMKWRLEPLVKAAEDKLAAVQVELAQLHADDLRQELEGCRDTLSRFADTLQHHADEFVRLDKELETQVYALAVAVKDIDVVHARALALANELRIPNLERTLGPKPDLANCALQVRRVVSANRAKENRIPLAPAWLAEAPDSGVMGWKLAGTTNQELSEIQAGAARARSQEAAVQQAAAFAAGVRAGAQAPPAPAAPATGDLSEAASAFRSAFRPEVRAAAEAEAARKAITEQDGDVT